MVNVQEWLEKKCPKEKRSEIRRIHLREPSLEGELDLSDFTYKHLRVYVYTSKVGETKIKIKNLPEEGKVIKLKNVKNAQEWLDENYKKGILGFERAMLEELDISKKNLEGDLDLSDFTGLEELDCSGNKLTSLNVSNCSSLTKFNCSNNITLQKNLCRVFAKL
jgi:Leucine-rich repeat (LRR) protein